MSPDVGEEPPFQPLEASVGGLPISRSRTRLANGDPKARATKGNHDRTRYKPVCTSTTEGVEKANRLVETRHVGVTVEKCLQFASQTEG